MNIFVHDDLRKEFESGYNIGQRGDGRFSVTGEEFTELHGTGSVDEAREAFAEYAKGKSGTLYWRIPPEIDTESGRFYMRLLISEKNDGGEK